jgi:hypothetical protein
MGELLFNFNFLPSFSIAQVISLAHSFERSGDSKVVIWKGYGKSSWPNFEVPSSYTEEKLSKPSL